MPYPERELKKHPHANPTRGAYGRNRQFWMVGRSGSAFRPQRAWILVDASRWLPHQGEREIARRRARPGGASA